MKKLGSQVLLWRMCMFVVGGVISASLNYGVFHFLHSKADLHSKVAYACSLGLTTLVLAMWNYHVNFRTQRRFRECLPRYLVALAICAGINYAIVAPFIHAWATRVFVLIWGVQSLVGVFKFGLYHFWVYPHGEKPQGCGSDQG